MKIYAVTIRIPPKPVAGAEGARRGSANEIVFDDTAADYGTAAAAAITAAVDTRPDVAGRLAELRRRLNMMRVTNRTYAKRDARRPEGVVDAPVLPRVAYTVESRTTGEMVTIEAVWKNAPRSDAPHPDA